MATDERCPKCGVAWELGRDVGGVVHTPDGLDCLRRQVAALWEREIELLDALAGLRYIIKEPHFESPKWVERADRLLSLE